MGVQALETDLMSRTRFLYKRIVYLKNKKEGTEKLSVELLYLVN